MYKVHASLLFFLSFFSASFAQIPEPPDLKFSGCFEAKESDPWNSPLRLGGGACLVAFKDDTTLWVSNQKGRNFAPFSIPAVMSAEMPKWNPTREVHECPTKVTRSGPWVQFYNEAAVLSTIPPERLECRGVVNVNGEILESTHFFYNANVIHTPSFWFKGSHVKTDINPQYTAGYVFLIPEKWSKRLGGASFACGNHPLQQTGHSHLGPTLFTADLATNPIVTRLVIGPKKSHWICHEVSSGETRRISGDELGFGATLIANQIRYDIEYTTRVTAACIMYDTLYYFGIEGVGKGWYGDRDIVIDGKPYRDLVSTAKGYHNESRRWVCWSYPMSIVEKCYLGQLNPEDAEAYSTKTVLSSGITSQLVNDSPIGCTADHTSGRIYLAVPMKLHSRSETTPLILTYQATKKPPVVRFETAVDGVRVLVDDEPKSSGPLVDFLNGSVEAKDAVLKE